MSTKTSFDIKEKPEIKKPSLYKVCLLNDDYTTMEFVVEVLEKVFHKNATEANKIMLNVHLKGKGVIGLYTYDIAYTKSYEAEKMARMKEFPLRVTVEKE